MHVYDRIRRCSFLSFDLSGLHWHLSGLSVLPLEQRPLVLLAGEPFPFASLFFRRRAFRFDLFVFVFERLFLYVRACCRRASSANTAQHNTSQLNPPCTKQQSKYAPIRARQRKQADRVGESQRLVEHLYSSPCSQNEPRNRTLPGLQITLLVTQTDDNGNAMFQSDLSKLFKNEPAEDTLVPLLRGTREKKCLCF